VWSRPEQRAEKLKKKANKHARRPFARVYRATLIQIEIAKKPINANAPSRLERLQRNGKFLSLAIARFLAEVVFGNRRKHKKYPRELIANHTWCLPIKIGTTENKSRARETFYWDFSRSDLAISCAPERKETKLKQPREPQKKSSKAKQVMINLRLRPRVGMKRLLFWVKWAHSPGDGGELRHCRALKSFETLLNPRPPTLFDFQLISLFFSLHLSLRFSSFHWRSCTADVFILHFFRNEMHHPARESWVRRQPHGERMCNNKTLGAFF
jgi:hypothetical protein